MGYVHTQQRETIWMNQLEMWHSSSNQFYMLSNSKEKSYQCNHCEYATSEATNLSTLKTQNGEQNVKWQSILSIYIFNFSLIMLSAHYQCMHWLMLMVADVDWCWLMIIDKSLWYWHLLVRIDAHQWLFMLIDFNWCWW